MRVLYLTNGFPYPLTSGYLRHYFLIRELAADHEVTLLSLAGQRFLAEDAEAMRPMLEYLEVFRGGPRSPLDRVVGRIRELGGRFEAPGVAAMADSAATQHAERPFDVVVHSGKSTHPVLDRLPGLPVAADLCDATSSRLAGALSYAAVHRRPILWLGLRAMRRIEAGIVQRAAHVMFASERDRRLILDTATTPASSIVPNGVDLEFWRRQTATLGRDRIVFTGAMHYPPNVDAGQVLVDRVLPLVRRRIPGACVDIVGRDPAPSLLALATRPGVRVTGYVPDVRPYLDAASVFAAPLRFGAGIQNKLLEALAMELPVVASTLAIDGLRVGEAAPPALVADDPVAMADAIVTTLETVRVDPTPSAAGREYVGSWFRWETSGRRLDFDPALRRRDRPMRPGRRRRTFSVALIGPDGAGKTTIARVLPERLPMRTTYLYMGVAAESSNKLLPTTRVIEAIKVRRRTTRAARPRATPPHDTDEARRSRQRRGPLKAAGRAIGAGLRLGNRVAEEWYRQGLAWSHQARGEVVLFDRHFYIDYHAADIAGAPTSPRRRLHGWMLEHAYPRPDLVVYLDAPVEVLLARKGEGTLESIARRQADYRSLAGEVEHFAIVDANRPLESVIDDVVHEIIAFAQTSPYRRPRGG